MSFFASPISFDNRILQTLPPTVLQHWQQRGQTVSLRVGETLYHPGDKACWAYFPLTAILVWVNLLENGASTGMAMVGHEGATGFDNLPSIDNHLMVHCAGQALRLPAGLVRESLQHLPTTRTVCRNFSHALITQVTQTAACNRHHNLEQQLIRLLLFTQDRTRDTVLQMTHEQMARMLGVRREGVTYAASLLQSRGLIGYTRGRITIADRQALVGRACECYHRVSRAERMVSP